MFCGKCGRNIGDMTVCPYCDPQTAQPNESIPQRGAQNIPQTPAGEYPPYAPQNPGHPYPEQTVQPYYPGNQPTQTYPQPPMQQYPQHPKKKSKKGLVIALIVILVVLLAGGGVAAFFLTAPARDYDRAKQLMNSGNYEEALAAFSKLGSYEDSDTYIFECHYLMAKQLFDNGQYDEAKQEFTGLGNYKDSIDLIKQCDYHNAQSLFDDGKYDEAKKAFQALGDLEDSKEKVTACDYELAKALMSSDPKEAIDALERLGDYKDSKDLLLDAKYAYCEAHKADFDDDTVYLYMKQLVRANYEGADKLYDQIYAYKIVDVFWNSDVEDDDPASGVSKIEQKKDKVLHFTLNGGTPDDDMTIKYKVIWPTGDVNENQYERPSDYYTLTLTNSPKGTLTVELYTDDGKLLKTTFVEVI